MFKIYIPQELRFVYADRYGNYYDTPEGEVVEKPFTESEAKAEVRKIRTQLLYESDWTQVADASLNDEQREEWRVYRQQLRDLMQGFQWGVTTWPRKP